MTHDDEVRDWAPVGTPALLAVAAFALTCLLIHGFSESGWVPILDSANLALHEGGHPLVGLFSARAMVYGGTLFQIAFPLAATWHFRRRGQPAGMAVALIWLGDNLLGIARYMADAQAQELPLIGDGHDWTEIFSRWGVLRYDRHIAGLTRLVASGLILGVMIRLLRRWRAGRQDA